MQDGQAGTGDAELKGSKRRKAKGNTSYMANGSQVTAAQLLEMAAEAVQEDDLERARQEHDAAQTRFQLKN